MAVVNSTNLILQTLVSVFNLGGIQNPPPTLMNPGFNPPVSFTPIGFKDKSDTKCYEQSGYGCFSIDSPWPKNRPVNLFPEHPYKINPNFCLFTKYNRDKCQPLRANDTSTFFNSFIKDNRQTFFIVHGYLESGNKTWIKKLSDELLKKIDANVIAVDWNGGSGPPYAQAVANIRLVGRAVAIMIIKLMEEVGLRPPKTHIIGHSLGAHTAGYAGSAVKGWHVKLGRITGLDPAEPHFADTDPEVRLDPSDADFVDVIHTDAAPFISGGFGIKQAVGHVDFYPNGGEIMPGCENAMFDSLGDRRGIVLGIRKALGCNHIRSYEYFTESVNTECDFMGVECNSFENYDNGLCFGCENLGGEKACARMGFHARPMGRRELVAFQLKTAGRDPFCRNQYLVELKISNSSSSQEHGGEVGAFYMQLNGTDGVTHRIKLQESATYFAPGSTWRRVVAATKVGEMRQIHLEWDFRHTVWNPLSWRLFGDPLIYLDEISITILETGERLQICPGTDEAFKSWIPRTFNLGTHSCLPIAA
ncbi:pancreatic triacylglycerol lipase-like [Neocloeon triangulifer]|uniref:pancreatic triacylglycerol lipase-like n=1 Tax=Neocloeon triangulifer TaxID=2078957 RepID=UPI00286F17BE|nr:pancreatic triacylglycerol lipase-like [Neocloeon triangulifer]